MKIIKYLLFAILLFAILLIATIAFIVMTVDTDSYKNEIVAAVERSTGRKLEIMGDLQLSFFPWLGLSMESVQLANASGFGDEPMIAVDQVKIKADLLSLVKGQPTVDVIAIHGLVANLKQNAQGVKNWDDLLAEKNAQTSEEEASSQIGGFHIEGIELIDAQLNWVDLMTESTVSLASLNLVTGKIAPQQATDLAIDFQLQDDEGNKIDVDMESSIIIDNNLTELKSDLLKLKANVLSEALPNKTLAIELDAVVNVDLEKGDITLQDMKVALGETELTGSFELKNAVKPKIAFSFVAKTLDLDQWLVGGEQDQASEIDNGSSVDPMIELPKDLMNAYDVEGALSANTILVSDVKLSDFSSTVIIENGVLSISSISIKLYQGTMRGGVVINSKASLPRYDADIAIENVQIDQLSMDFLGEEQAYLRGVSQLSLTLSSQGHRVSELLKALQGKGDFLAADGALRDRALAEKVESAVAFMKSRDPKPVGEEIVFDELSASYNISDGIMNNDDLKLVTSLILADGQGVVDLPNQALNYRVSLRFSEDPDSLVIPLTASGSLQQPNYGLDLNAILTNPEATEKQLDKTKEDLDKKVDELKSKFGFDL